MNVIFGSFFSSMPQYSAHTGALNRTLGQRIRSLNAALVHTPAPLSLIPALLELVVPVLITPGAEGRQGALGHPGGLLQALGQDTGLCGTRMNRAYMSVCV